MKEPDFTQNQIFVMGAIFQYHQRSFEYIGIGDKYLSPTGTGSQKSELQETLFNNVQNKTPAMCM